VLVALPPASAWDDVPCFANWGAAGGAHYGYIRGTSFSSPEVAGVAALIWAARPELTNYQVADIIKASARRDTVTGWTPVMGCGVLDAGAALELATSRTQIGVAAGPCSTAGAGPSWPVEARQTITFGPLPDRKAGAPDFVVKATASSGLSISLAPNGQCTVSGARVHITGVGVCTLIATQEGNEGYNPALPVTQTFSITKGQRAAAAKPLKQKKAKPARAKRPPRGSAHKN
jgi:subtilisin family serine protease